jgi:hypothetical protein
MEQHPRGHETERVESLCASRGQHAESGEERARARAYDRGQESGHEREPGEECSEEEERDASLHAKRTQDGTRAHGQEAHVHSGEGEHVGQPRAPKRFSIRGLETASIAEKKRDQELSGGPLPSFEASPNVPAGAFRRAAHASSSSACGTPFLDSAEKPPAAVDRARLRPSFGAKPCGLLEPNDGIDAQVPAHFEPRSETQAVGGRHDDAPSTLADDRTLALASDDLRPSRDELRRSDAA